VSRTEVRVVWWSRHGHVAQEEPPLPEPSPVEEPLFDPDRVQIDSWQDVVELLRATLTRLVGSLIEALPLIMLALLIVVLGVVVAGLLSRWTEQGLRRTPADQVVIGLTGKLIRFVVIVVFAIAAFSVTGVNVGAALATLGLAGLALAFALQNILENFVAGLLLLIRKPFRAGDQIRTADPERDLEGTVQEIDLRVTRLISYDGELVLVPNSDVFRNPIVNLTRRGRRRSEVVVGIDYRDDHEHAREVLLDAVKGAEGVLDQPEPKVLLDELADSSVDFRIFFWTLPDIASVLGARDRVLSATKSAVEAAGMTIPWPIRTVDFDNRLQLEDGRPPAARSEPS
jgi:small conductance mechanosensitive channel